MPRKYKYEGMDFCKHIFPEKSKLDFIVQKRVYYDLIRSKYLMNKYLGDRKHFWGIDPSFTGTGIAIIDLDSGDIILDKLSTRPTDFLITRVNSLVNRIRNLLKLYPPLFVIMEGTFFAAGQPGSYSLGKLNMMLEEAIYDAGGALYKNVSPKSIKIFTTLNHLASKEEMIAAIGERYGHVFFDVDVADAYAMCRIGMEIYKLMCSIDNRTYDINLPSQMDDFHKYVLEFVGKNEARRGKELFSILKSRSLNGLHTLSELLPMIRKHKLRREAVKINVFRGADRSVTKKLCKNNNH